MTRTILVAGTASHVGKSTVVAGLCRMLASRGFDVAPFKAQNMSNNAWVVPVAGSDGRAGEIGVSQYVQAIAARVRPTTDNNPVLLKPRGDGESQVVIQGEAVGHASAGAYFDGPWHRARRAAVESYERLAGAHDVIVAEGAGSIAEPNLLHRDLANIETARFADAEILLLADIDRGGAFASLLGSVEWLPADVRDRIVGAAFTKFRGDRGLLADGIDRLEDRTGIPVVGVLPYDDPGLPAEDSVTLPADGARRVFGADDGVASSDAVRIGVPRLPRISNFTDLDPLAREPGVRVVLQPPSADLSDLDAIVIPGTKNTVDDLIELVAASFDDRIRRFEGPIVGLCGGYQMLGRRLLDAHLEGTGGERTVDGFDLLPIETRFGPDKRVRWTRHRVLGGGPLGDATGTVAGYEIHHGETVPIEPIPRPFEGEGSFTDSVLGTYLHGVFENESVRRALLDHVFDRAGRDRPDAIGTDPESPYDRAAAIVETHLDVDAIGLAGR